MGHPVHGGVPTRASVLACVKVVKCRGPVLAVHPLSPPSPHQCSACSALYPASTVQAWLAAATASLSKTEGTNSSVEQCEQTLHLLSDRLHPGHLLLIQLKQRLSALYGSSPCLSRPARERRLQLLMDLVESNSKVRGGRWGRRSGFWIFLGFDLIEF